MAKMIDSAEFAEWVRTGMDNGWITEPFCNTHDVDPGMGEDEQEAWNEGFDPCQHVLRILV